MIKERLPCMFKKDCAEYIEPKAHYGRWEEVCGKKEGDEFGQNMYAK